MIGAMALPMVHGVVGHRLHRAGLPMGAAVGMNRDGWSLRRGGHASPRHREGGDRQGYKSDNDGAEPVHGA